MSDNRYYVNRRAQHPLWLDIQSERDSIDRSRKMAQLKNEPMIQ
jgi:hypothetical protein